MSDRPTIEQIASGETGNDIAAALMENYVYPVLDIVDEELRGRDLISARLIIELGRDLEAGQI